MTHHAHPTIRYSDWPSVADAPIHGHLHRQRVRRKHRHHWARRLRRSAVAVTLFALMVGSFWLLIGACDPKISTL